MNQIKNDSVNDFKIVTFKNISNFDFTPVLGAMYDSRPIFGKTGSKSIVPGEEIMLPYHVGFRLAVNLAKAIFMKAVPAPEYEKGSDKTEKPVYNDETLAEKVKEILIGEYQEERPIAESETDKLIRKYEELNTLVQTLKGDQKVTPAGYKDKKEVITELEKRGIKHDPRKSKADLEKLLSSPEAK